LSIGPQQQLVSGTNIKTINGASVLGSGDLVVGGSNIYNANGTLTSARTLTSGGFPLTFTGSNTAASGISRGLNLTHTLVAAANSNVLVGLDLRPTFTNGAFTGVSNFGLRIEQGTQAGNNTSNIVFKRTDVANSAVIGFQGLGWNIFGIWGEGTITATNAPDIGVFAGTGHTYVKNNLLIGTTTNAGFKLDVNGTARVSGRITALNGANMTLTSNYAAEIGFNVNGRLGIGYNVASGSIIQALFSTSAADLFVQPFGGALMIGENVLPNASASVQINSTTKGFLPPRMTTTQRDAITTPATGLQIYNTTTNTNDYYNGTEWAAIGAGGGGGASALFNYYNFT